MSKKDLIMYATPEMREVLFSRGADYLEGRRDNSGKGFLCPACSSGSGNNGTGISLNPSSVREGHPRYKCFACGWYGDIVDYIAREYGIEEGTEEAFKKARDILNVSASSASGIDLAALKKKREADSKKAQEEAEANIRKAAKYSKECCDNPPAEYFRPIAEYLKGRGIDTKTAQKLHFGQGKNNERPLVIPTVTYGRGFPSYIEVRLSDGDKRNPKGVGVGFTGADALRQDKRPVFITEGFADAASFVQIGAEAVSLNGVMNWQQFVAYIKENKPACKRFIVALDSDDAGRKEAEPFRAELQRLGYPTTIFDIVKDVDGMDEKTITKKNGESKPVKDANDALRAAPDMFIEGAAAAEDKAKTAPAAEILPDDKKNVDRYKIGNQLDKIFDNIKEYENPIPTGFEGLDNIIAGGLLPKMYVIGALSSLGKTTFALQIADNIAKNGRDVLIFSQEMPTSSYVAKSISRNMYQLKNDKTYHAKGYNLIHEEGEPKTEQQILIPKERKAFSEADKQLLAAALAEYKDYAFEHIFIRDDRVDVDQIYASVKLHKLVYGVPPVVIVDYLQILKPAADVKNASKREQVDYAVSVLAAIRSDLKAPVIVISSFNRNSYNADASNSSFKESGEIEYTGDVTIVLEPHDVDKDKDGKIKTEDLARHMKNPKRTVRLSLPKNRLGIAWGQCFFEYTPAHNTFREISETEADIAKGKATESKRGK